MKICGCRVARRAKIQATDPDNIKNEHDNDDDDRC